MKSKQRTLLSCAIGSVLGIGGAAALAQETSRTSVLEEVVVTAEKREANIQDVPVAVSAYTSERRDVLGLNTVEDFARFTPSLTYRNNDRLSMRGFGRLTNSIGTDPSIALYSDGIFSTSMADTSTPSLFIERTEILRGPQGTLYGRNSIGGTLNIISKRPTDKFQGEVRGSVGNYGEWHTDALLRGPFSDSVRYLIGGSMARRDEGFVENRGPAEDTATVKRWMVEAQLEADLGENAVARIRYSKFDWDDTYGVGNTLLNNISPYDTLGLVGNGNGALYYNTARGNPDPNPAVNDPYTMNTNRDAPGVLRDHQRIHLDVTWDLGGTTLKYLGGYQEYGYDTGGDYDGGNRTGFQSIANPAGIAALTVDFDGAAGPLTPFTFANPAFTATNASVDSMTFYTEEQSWWSNELNLSSNGEGAVQWIVGVYQYNQKYDQPQGIRIPNDPSLAAPANSAIPNPDRNILLVDGHLETDSYAGFGQIDWGISDKWTLTLGARYTKDKKDGWDYARLIARGPTTATGAADTPSTLENAIIGQVRTLAGNPNLTPAQVDGFLRANPATATAIFNGVSAAVLAQTQALALDVTQSQVCGAVACPADMRASPRGGLERDLSGDWDAVTGTVGLRWEPTENTNTYLRYSRGYKSGGWLGSNGLTLNPYADPEYVNSYELGWKQQVSGRLQLNTAVYFNDYKGFQAPLTVLRDQSTESRFLNLDAETYGVEIETVWSPVDALQLFFNYGYLHTKITDGCCFVDSVDPAAVAPGAKPVTVISPGRVAQSVEGNNLPLSPENKWTIGFNYTWGFTPGSLTFTGMYTDTDDQQSSIWTNPAYVAPSFEIADLRILWNDAKDRYTVIGFVKNAFDEVGYGSVVPSSPTPVGIRREVSLTFPRTFGMEVQYRF
ncbi:MAG TPA: TonB-dependent receptor [Steroidobacteraceae bacterium]|nr:TonB-dependent receptor [Steroidobacteraceae bacterium]